MLGLLAGSLFWFGMISIAECLLCRLGIGFLLLSHSMRSLEKWGPPLALPHDRAQTEQMFFCSESLRTIDLRKIRTKKRRSYSVPMRCRF